MLWGQSQEPALHAHAPQYQMEESKELLVLGVLGFLVLGELSCLSKKCMPCVCSPERGWTISLFSLFQSLHSGSKTGERLNQQPTLGRQRKCKGPGHSVENTRRELTPAHSPASGPQPSWRAAFLLLGEQSAQCLLRSCVWTESKDNNDKGPDFLNSHYRIPECSFYHFHISVLSFIIWFLSLLLYSPYTLLLTLLLLNWLKKKKKPNLPPWLI